MSWVLFAISLPFVLIGLVDVYMMIRFVKSANGKKSEEAPKIDSTSGWLFWYFMKWAVASQPRALAEKLPWLSQDLNELLGIREDDGRVT